MLHDDDVDDDRRKIMVERNMIGFDDCGSMKITENTRSHGGNVRGGRRPHSLVSKRACPFDFAVRADFHTQNEREPM